MTIKTFVAICYLYLYHKLSQIKQTLSICWSVFVCLSIKHNKVVYSFLTFGYLFAFLSDNQAVRWETFSSSGDTNIQPSSGDEGHSAR